MHNAEKLRRGKLYPVALEDWGRIGSGVHRANVRARWAGEKRPPKRGEWFLSGAIIEAHYAPNDLSEAYRIAELVEVRVIYEASRTLEEVVRVL